MTNFANYQGTAAPLAGLTRRREKRKKISTTKGNAQGKFKIVSYCPHCPIQNMVHPESNPHVVVQASTRRGTCKNGHIWQVIN